jgi:hypothetical protein
MHCKGFSIYGITGLNILPARELFHREHLGTEGKNITGEET